MSQHIPDCNCFVCKGRELESLKAQLAQAQETNRELNRRVGSLEHAIAIQSEKGAWKRYYDAACDIYERAEAQVRELRELLRRITSHHMFNSLLSVKVRREIEAALRSAPPSGLDSDAIQHPTKYGPAPRVAPATGSSENTAGNVQMSPSVKQAPLRKDLAKVPAASDGFTGSREVGEDARKSSTADKSVEYSTPQDSLSRSESEKCVCGHQEPGNFNRCKCGIDVDFAPPWGHRYGCVHRREPAPPSPAPEKEKAE